MPCQPVTRKRERLKGVRLLFRSSVIRNGVDLGFFVDQSRDDACADSLGVKGKFVAAYVGTHGMAHGLDVILDAAEMLQDRDDIVFLTAGDGAERKLSHHKN
ncbi:hypothetical protein [Methylotuvimicrobium sp. KM1]|uniref:hypothetical protein n=1 Tax=Methylotuvimicrobium sp. KM1 TaxID=3377707 RepID=UPI0038503C3D